MSAPQRAGWADLDPATLHDLVRLRVDVFVVEQACPYPEIDGRDVEPGTEHVWVPAGARRVAAYLRVLAEPDGTRRVGRVVTHPTARGQGLAARLMDDVLDRHGEVPLVLDAQSHLAHWYARFGFVADGPEFVEDGIPHTPMRRAPGQRHHGVRRPPGDDAESVGRSEGGYGSPATSSDSATRGPV